MRRTVRGRGTLDQLLGRGAVAAPLFFETLSSHDAYHHCTADVAVIGVRAATMTFMNASMRIVASLSLFALAATTAGAATPCTVNFASPRSYDRGLALRIGVEVADFDGDGLPDIASLHRYGNDGTPNRTGTHW